MPAKLEGDIGEKKPLNRPLPGTTASKPPAPKVPHAKPRAEGESDESYNKRTANFAKSQERLKSVGITGGVNKASAEQLKSFREKYGRDPSGLKEKEPVKPDMSAENPAKPKKDTGGQAQGKLKGDELSAYMPRMSSPKTATSKDVKSLKDKDTIMKAAEKSMSYPPKIGRRMRRMKRKLMSKKPMAGGY